MKYRSIASALNFSQLSENLGALPARLLTTEEIDEIWAVHHENGAP
jgi:hypothetical protein